MIKYKTFIIKTFDQVKNDKVKFDQPTLCPEFHSNWKNKMFV